MISYSRLFTQPPVFVIDPTCMSTLEATLLRLVIDKFVKDDSDILYSCYENPTHPKVSYQIKYMNSDTVIALEKDLVRFESKSTPGTFKFSVIDSGKVLGTGAFAVVMNVLGTLSFDSNGLHTYKEKFQRRVAKYIYNKPESRNVAENEHRITSKLPRFKTKRLAVDAERARFVLLTRFFPGRELFDILSTEIETDKSIFTLDQRLDLSIKHCLALKNQIHAYNVIHRDLKPENTLIATDTNNNIVDLNIIDLGLAKDAPSADDRLTRRKLVIENCGSEEYASPEQLNNLLTDERSDLYELGLVLDRVWEFDSRGLSSEHVELLNDILDLMLDEDINRRPEIDVIVAMFTKIVDERKLLAQTSGLKATPTTSEINSSSSTESTTATISFKR